MPFACALVAMAVPALPFGGSSVTVDRPLIAALIQALFMTHDRPDQMRERA
ncbi:MAG: hypothetical protein NVS3B5_15490 [Sphingomicrobium sp.]